MSACKSVTHHHADALGDASSAGEEAGEGKRVAKKKKGKGRGRAELVVCATLRIDVWLLPAAFSHNGPDGKVSRSPMASVRAAAPPERAAYLYRSLSSEKPP